MNGKKAKALRQMAQKLTVGMPEKKYGAYKDNHHTVVLIRDCTRSFYQRLKDAYMQQKFNH